jgi:cysteine synthase A
MRELDIDLASSIDGAIGDALEHLESLAPLVGNTPLAAIDFTFRGANRTLYAKLESMSFTGSVKDRMALHVLRRGYENGLLEPGGRIVEATSGNTGISFAALGRALGHPVTIFMPDWMSAERINLLRAFGADIELVSKEDGGFLGSIERAEEAGQRMSGAFLPRQFDNEHNAEAHELTTGPEIVAQLRAVTGGGAGPDAFVAGVGTGGTVMGVGRHLHALRHDVKVHPLEPSNSPTLTTGHKVGCHRIQGISDEFIPPIVDLRFLDGVISVDDGDAILMAQALARTLGLAVGISSGANFLGALIAQEQLGPDAIVATVFADSNKKYLSTDLMRPEPARVDFLSPQVKLLRYRVLPRRCDFCPPSVRRQG